MVCFINQRAASLSKIVAFSEQRVKDQKARRYQKSRELLGGPKLSREITRKSAIILKNNKNH